MSEYVQYQAQDGVAEITMNRGPVNAINHQLAREVVDAYKRAKSDTSVRVVGLLDTVMAYERGDWDMCLRLAAVAGIQPDWLPSAHADALGWAEQLMRPAARKSASKSRTKRTTRARRR